MNGSSVCPFIVLEDACFQVHSGACIYGQGTSPAISSKGHFDSIDLSTRPDLHHGFRSALRVCHGSSSERKTKHVAKGSWCHVNASMGTIDDTSISSTSPKVSATEIQKEGCRVNARGAGCAGALIFSLNSKGAKWSCRAKFTFL